MEQFSLEKYLENPSRKVVTRDRKPVRIVCWDSPNKAFPIVGFIDNNPTVFVWDYYGYFKAGHVESKCDLFFAEEEEKFTEFESKLADLLVYNHPIDIESAESIAKRKSKQLLDLARKEILKDALNCSIIMHPNDRFANYSISAYVPPLHPASTYISNGDKVKIIIIRE